MANEKLKQNYKDIANSIRAKTGENGTIKAEEMPAKIDGIPTGVEPEGNLDITANGEYNIRLKNTVNVNVPNPSTGTKNITTNGDHDVTAFATAHVAVPQPSGTLEENLTKNVDGWSGTKTIDVTNYETLELDYDFWPSGTTYESLSLSPGDSDYVTYDVTEYDTIQISYEVSGGGSYKECGYMDNGIYTSNGAGTVYCQQGYGSVSICDETQGMSVGDSKEISTGDGYTYTLTRTN